jgi:hypothetical protein
MGTDELHQHAPECKRHVHDKPLFIAAESKDDPVIAREIDSAARLCSR